MLMMSMHADDADDAHPPAHDARADVLATQRARDPLRSLTLRIARVRISIHHEQLDVQGRSVVS